mgnify:CR=1 FL=1
MANNAPIGSERLATRLKALRGALTQEQAAARAGISGNTWQNLERAVTRANPSTVQRIAQGFDLDYDELWSYVVDTPLHERFTDEELDRLAARLAPLLAARLRQQN